MKYNGTITRYWTRETPSGTDAPPVVERFAEFQTSRNRRVTAFALPSPFFDEFYGRKLPFKCACHEDRRTGIKTLRLR